jgi:hypothetical protein
MKKFPLLPAALLLVAISISATAQSLPCKSNYDSVISAIDGAAIGAGNKTKLRSHINNALRKFSSGKKQGLDNALKDVDQALKLLASNATAQVPPQTRASLVQAIESLRSCFTGSPTGQIATLQVRTFLQSDVSPDGISGPAPAGVIIFVDDVEVGITNAAGEATLEVPARTLQIEARLYPSSAGETVITLAPNETKQVDIVLLDGKELSENATLTIDQLADGMLDRNFSALTLRFTKTDGSTAALKTIDFVALLSNVGGASKFATEMFTLQADGTLVLNNLAGFRALLLSQAGKILLNVHGEDANGRIYNQTTEFFISTFKVVGHLSAPPSNPTLNTAGIFVTGAVLNTSLVFNTTSDASGNFEFPLLPSGNLEISSETLQNGSFYYGQGVLVLTGNKSVNLNMLSTVDLVNGVVPFTVTSIAEPVTALSAQSDDDVGFGPTAGEFSARNQLSSLASMAVVPSALTTVSVNVTAGSQNTAITRTATVEVPQGTKTVDLTYTVQTAEYPTFVLAQSIFNDTWGVSVRGGASGQQLFNITRQINSQLTVDPVWQNTGSTGAIKRSINVESLAASGPTSLVLFASAMNVGDSILATSVTATLGADSSVKINSATPDSSVPLNFHSIPRPGALNHFERIFKLKISKPAGSTVKKVVATLLGPGPLMIVVDEAPGGGSVTVVDDETLNVRVSMHTLASTVNNPPPPVHELKYRFKLVVDVNGADVSDEKDSGERRALWRMPDGFARYSLRDAGGDDWCSRGTYNWLLTNAAHISKINDISGEHGRNIGHATHKHGTDIDIFHFFTFPGAGNGQDNYNKLRDDVKLAANTGSADPVVAAQALAAKARVIAWINATHTGLDALAASATVIELRYALGIAGSGLAHGWARDLLKTGKVTISGQEVDFGTGAWSNAKYIPVNDHNDHIHVTLSRPVLGEG